jgi:hypothetical protein
MRHDWVRSEDVLGYWEKRSEAEDFHLYMDVAVAVLSQPNYQSIVVECPSVQLDKKKMMKKTIGSSNRQSISDGLPRA